jgi:hypothetical protein
MIIIRLENSIVGFIIRLENSIVGFLDIFEVHCKLSCPVLHLVSYLGVSHSIVFIPNIG